MDSDGIGNLLFGIFVVGIVAGILILLGLGWAFHHIKIV